MPRLALRHALPALLSLGAGLAAACAPDLPVSQRIAAPRILAMRSEVVGPLFPDETEDAGVRCEALPFEKVRVTPFMAAPEGALDIAGPDFDPIWISCNLGFGEGLFACLKGAIPLGLDALPTCPVPSFADIDPASMELPDSPSPCRLPDDGSDDGRQDFVVPLAATLLIGGDIEVTMISRGPGSPDTRTCAEALLGGAADLPNECIYAVARVSVGPIERMLALAQMFGFMLPPELGTAPDPGDIPDSDRNPRIASFRVTRIDPEGNATELGEQPRGALVEARLGDTLHVDTTTPAADLQSYPVAVNAGAGGMSSETQEERLDGSWYRTWGVLLSGGSDDLESFNEWTMELGEQDEDTEPPGGRATLYYVLRDSRDGTDWWWLDVQVTP